MAWRGFLRRGFSKLVLSCLLQRFLGSSWVAQLWDRSGEVGTWNLVFTRLNNDWEMKEVEVFFKRLYGQVLRRDNEDVMS